MRNSPTKNIGLALLRIVPSIMLMTHGIPKFQNLINGNFEFPNPLGIGAAPSLFLTIIGEVICPILLIIGFKTRWAAVPSAITMMVAAFIVHKGDPFGNKELALVYLVIFIVIILIGPGKYSMDRN